MMSVSVAMATYNGARYIDRQLASLATQTYLPTELVIIDDDSHDETVELITTFARKAPFPVRIYRNPTRLGYRASFMRGTTLSNSELIAFCDQDDVWGSDKIQSCIPMFENPDVFLVYHNAIVVTEDEKPIGSLRKYAAPLTINPPMSIDPWLSGLGFTLVFRRSLTRLNGLWPLSVDQINMEETMAHDQWFFFLSSALGCIAYLSGPLAYYRQHRSNLYGWYVGMSFADRLRLSFRNPADDYARLEYCSGRRADILERAKEEWGESWHSNASPAVSLYRRLERIYRARRMLYTAVEVNRRIRAFGSILLSGGYKRGDGFSLGLKSLIKDAFIGLLIGHRLRHKIAVKE
jgi:glycosyltransferase involved in cell wall biosynthesis